MKKLHYILIGLVLYCCQDIENCDTDDNQEFMIVRFFDYESKQPKKAGFTIGSGNVLFVGNFYASDSTSAGLPLDPSKDSTAFFFLTDTTQDVLVMSYEASFSVFDPKCDPSLTFLNLDTIRYTFDSVAIPGTVTNRQLSTNVEIYF